MRQGFDPNSASTWNAEERAVYDTGYREGESSQLADWQVALSEGCELPDDVDVSNPWSVAAYIARLSGAQGDGRE